MATKTAAPLKPTDPLPNGTRVILTQDLVGIPSGTLGKVVFVEGLSWIRYWVHFDTGERRGQIGRTKLMTIHEWEHRGSADSRATASGDGRAAASDAPTADGGGSTNAYGVPDLLLERSKTGRILWAEKHPA